MRDYAELINRLRRSCAILVDGGKCEDCAGSRCMEIDAADAIEELQDQIADVSKMICDLIAYAQKNADESREAEQRHYGSDSTVNVYTWMHNSKCIYERFVRDLEDLILPMKEGANEDR